MQNSVNSVNQHMKFTPNKNVVVTPPATVYKYSVYDELRLGENKYDEIMTAIQTPSEGNKALKRRSVVRKLINTAVVIGLGVLGWKSRGWILAQWKKLPFINK